MTGKKSMQMVLIVLALVAAACGSGDGESAATPTGGVEATEVEALTVVASTTVLGDVITEIVGDDATVEVLIPVGADPHDFQPSSQQVSLIGTVDLVVVNGLGLEEGLHDVLESAESDGANILEVAPLLDPIPFGEHEHHDHEEDEDHESAAPEGCDPEMAHQHEEDDHSEDAEHDHEHGEEGDAHDHEHGEEDDAHDHEHGEEDDAHDHEHGEEGDAHDHEHGSCDPHVWMDPMRMAEASRLIAAELDEVAPEGPWSDRAEAYAHELLAANTQIEEMLSVIPDDDRVLVTNHDAFGYFTALYDFEVVGTVIPGGSTLGDPSSAELAGLVEVINEEDVPAIFTESTAPSALAESVAQEVGEDIEIVELYSGSLGEPESEADTLIGLLTTNSQRIADALR